MYLALTDRLLNIKFVTEILENFDVDYCLLPGRNTVIVLTVLRKSDQLFQSIPWTNGKLHESVQIFVIAESV